MRNALLVGATALAVAAMGCGGGSSGPRRPPPLDQDYAANFTGTWNVAGSVQMGTSFQQIPPGTQQVTSPEPNVLLFLGSCADGSPLRAIVTSPSTCDFDSLTCTQPESCGTVTISFSKGSGHSDQGTLSVTLTGTASGCGTSLPFTMSFGGTRGNASSLPNSVPALASLDPATATAGGTGLTLIVRGSGFVPASMVTWDGSARATIFVSPTELHTSISSYDLYAVRSIPISVVSPAPGGGTSNALAFTVVSPAPNPVPSLAAIAPTFAAAGGPSFTLVATGTGFVPASTVTWDGSARPTTFVSATELHASISAADIAAARSVLVGIISPAPGGGTSNQFTFDVSNPTPSAAALYPSSAPPGGPRFTLTVIGTGFVPSSAVTWNGSARATTFVSATELHAAIESSDIASSGAATVAVDTPAPGGGTSAALSFAVAAADNSTLSTAVTYQIDPGHSGRTAFGTALAFPPHPTWTVKLGGAVSYPLIAGGKVFVLTGGSATGGYGTQLYALDEATGGIAWGPIAIGGTYFWSGHAYDSGTLFVVNFDGLLRSFDAATGQAGWSVELPGQYAFSSPPTAVNGVVYVGGAGSGGTVYAVDEANGKVLWTAGVMNGDDSSPAVSLDGVFVSYPCQVYKLGLATGSTMWHVSGPCEGGGGKTASYANGSVYVRDPYETTPVGTIYDASSGSKLGSFGVSTAGMPIPAFSPDAGFFSSGGTLRRQDLAGGSVAWSFAGDGKLSSAPIVIDGVVIVGSTSGNVYAIDAATGAQAWVGSAGAPISAPDEQNVSAPLTGLGAGEGYLVVPAGSSVAAWRIASP